MPEPAVPQHTRDQVAEVNATGRVPVVLLHGLWLPPQSWDPWIAPLHQAGYAPFAPHWPGEPRTVEQARAEPGALAGARVGGLADHLAAVAGLLERRPVLVGHSLGGLLAMLLADRGLAAATVAVDAAPFRGVLPVPLPALRAVAPVLARPGNRRRTVTLDYPHFRYAFANAVGEDEARRLHAAYAVPAPGAPVFEAATANLAPRTRLRLDPRAPHRGPLLVVAGERDNTVPPAISRAAYRRQSANPAPTEYAELPGRGHSLTVDAGWPQVCELVTGFARRVAAP